MSNKKKVELTDELILPLMKRYSIDRTEAEKRLNLLFQSGILDTHDPRTPEGQYFIDGFLCETSEVLEGKVSFHAVYSTCLRDEKLIKEYDRLKGVSLGSALFKAGMGNPPKELQTLMEDFAEFVREFIYDRLPKKPAPNEAG